MIADEFVSTLDVSLQAQILNLFQYPRQEWGIARLFAFHDRDVVSNIRNLAAALHSGRIVEDAEKIIEERLAGVTSARESAPKWRQAANESA